MTPWQERADALTLRMAQDMKLRNLSQSTIDAYTYHVGRFSHFLHENSGRDVTDATPEDVRAFQLHLIEVRKVGWSSFNQAVCGLRFLYRITMPKSWHVDMIPFGKRPKKLPEVLSSQEVDALLSCVKSLKHKTLMLTLYAAGLRLGEASNLTTSDIDSKRMQLAIRNAKGAKDRRVPLSPRLLEELRHYWKAVVAPLVPPTDRRQAVRAAQYLFPGKTLDVPLVRAHSIAIRASC